MNTTHNINTMEYWDGVYDRPDKEFRVRRSRGRNYMASIIPLMRLPGDYQGSIMDFGCGMGFGIEELRDAFPQARLIGVDHSSKAIEFCRKTHGTIADFVYVTSDEPLRADVIVSSHVMEHLTNDREVAGRLLAGCSRLFIAVPYREKLSAPGAIAEHVNSYDEHYYDGIANFVKTDVVWNCRNSFFRKCQVNLQKFRRFLTQSRYDKYQGKHIVFSLAEKPF